MWNIVTSGLGYIFGVPCHWTTAPTNRKKIEVFHKKGRVKVKITDEDKVTELDGDPKEALEFAMAIATNAKLAKEESK